MNRKPKRKVPRSGAAIAMMLRYGKTMTTYKDRREPRGGAKNRQRQILLELE
jgi:hypothetical protein